jgi:hypothetical protein
LPFVFIILSAFSTFPLRFWVGELGWNIIAAFAAVAMALSHGAWMTTSLMEIFERSDMYDLTFYHPTNETLNESLWAEKYAR